jgi:hypothetical protein
MPDPASSGGPNPVPTGDRDGERREGDAAAAAPDLNALFRNFLQTALNNPASVPTPEESAPKPSDHPDHERVKEGLAPVSGFVSFDNPIQVNSCPRPPTALFEPQFFPVWNETSQNLPAAQKHEHEVLYAITSFLQDHVQSLHECAAASGYKPIFVELRDHAAGILSLSRKRLDALRVMASKGVDAGAYVAAATINPLAHTLDDPESRAALEKYDAQVLRRDLNKSVWGTGRGGGRFGGASTGFARGASSGAAAAFRPSNASSAAPTGAAAQPPAGGAVSKSGAGRGRGRFGGKASN